MRKIIPFSIFCLMLVFFILPSDVFAVEVDGRDYSYFVEFRSSPSSLTRFYSTEPILMNSTRVKYKGWAVKYMKIGNDEWFKDGSANFYSDYYMISGASPYEVISSSHDIIDPVTGTVFFSGPLPKYQVTVAEMGEVSLGNLITDFGQTLGTLLPVGLILSSMVLALYLVRRFLPLFGLSSK